MVHRKRTLNKEIKEMVFAYEYSCSIFNPWKEKTGVCL